MIQTEWSKSMSQILLVEDDPVLGRGLVVNLELENYEVAWAKDLASAYKTIESKTFHLIILDLGLPDGSGLSLCTKLRESGSKVPIVILTAHTDEDSVVEGLNTGANDYVRKPFGNRELLARVRTHLKEPTRRENQMRYAHLLLLPDRRKAFVRDQEVELSRREFDVLLYLVEHAEAVVTREALLSALDREGEIFDRTIDSHLSHLRSRLRQSKGSGLKITSVYGIGYRLEKDEGEAT
jgi:DNA-binding response OmpR family regulator